MEVRLEHIGDVAVVQVSDESLAAHDVKEFKTKIAHLTIPHAKIVFDMGNLRFIDSSGIGALLSWMKKVQSLNGSLTFCNVTRPVRNLLELLGVHRFLPIFTDVEEAIRSLGG